MCKRGRADAPRTGRWLAESGFEPDLELYSPARRTRQTWQLAVPALKDSLPVVYDERLYNAAPSMLATVLAERGPHLCSLVLAGHNQGLHELAVGLRERPSGPAGAGEGGFADLGRGGDGCARRLGAAVPGQRDRSCLLVTGRLTAPVGCVRPPGTPCCGIACPTS
ncbi:SixA phosphatase family protein [Streptomyces sp. NPDC090741]|uniref:SixA phosphatase family protein n=1 Tax=Streptomyces sp. NPDC090741 TaxID=3365967 RepID=UPI003827AF13